MPIRLTDPQLRRVMETAGLLAVEKRDAFLQRLGAALRMNGTLRPTNIELDRVTRAALQGLMREPAA